MALLKAIDQHGSGHICSYWRVTSVAVDHVAGKVFGTLSGYRDEAARRMGLNPLFTVKGDWTGADLGVDLHFLVTSDIYWGFIQSKELGLFADAESDLPPPTNMPQVALPDDAGAECAAVSAAEPRGPAA